MCGERSSERLERVVDGREVEAKVANEYNIKSGGLMCPLPSFVKCICASTLHLWSELKLLMFVLLCFEF